MAERRRLLVVSNRGPVAYDRAPDGSRLARRGGGGLVTALAGLVAAHDVTWVASALGEEDRAVAAEAGHRAVEETDRAGNRFHLRLVTHDEREYDRFYNVFANPLLWYVQHALWPLVYQPELDRGTALAWDAYRAVNRAFAEAACEELERLGPGTAVLLHDYQLYTCARHVREAVPDAVLSHFCHIPWPGQTMWRVLPRSVRDEIAWGLLANDVCGFHTVLYAREFVRFCEDMIGCHVDHDALTVEHGGRLVRARAYPISVDPAEFDALAASEEVRAFERVLEEDRPERLILRVDRTDPSKNVVRGFHAFDRFLAQHPEWRGRVRMLALLHPSRQDIPEYAEYRGAIQRAARDVGDRWSGPDGRPAVDLRIQDNFHEAVAAYRQYDVLLVNALVDGMNLIAKEAPLVNARDGVLILSENAGAHAELGDLALTISPYDVQGQADAIAAALEMPEADRAARAAELRARVRENDLGRWIGRQLAELDEIGAAR